MALTKVDKSLLETTSGTADETTFLRGDGTWAEAGVGDNPVFSGTASATIPQGTTAQRPGSPTAGMIRFNTTNTEPEWYDNGSSSWIAFGSDKPYSIDYVVIAGAGGGGGGGGLSLIHI